MAKTLEMNQSGHSAPLKGRSCAETQRNMDVSPVQLLLSLQSSLDPRQILERFFSFLSQKLGVQGLRTWLDGADHALELGTHGRYQVDFGLQHEGGTPARLLVMRSSPFDEAEQARLEELVALVHYPLRNAALYQHALRTAREDELTGLYNRVALKESLERELSLAQRYEQPLSVVMIDVDGFKQINDVHGHRVGDRVLRCIADILRECARCSDLLFRYAGDEFIVIASHTDLAGARAFAQRVCDRTEACVIRHHGESVTPQISLGVVEAHADDNYDGLFDRADRAMYRAKGDGRNRVVAVK